MSNLTPDAQEFLLFSYFGKTNPAIEDFINRAYRDLCRTLSGIGKHEKKEEWKKSVTTIMIESIEVLTNDGILNQQAFDDWHEATCNQIIQQTTELLNGIKFYYGHAQKWLNMTLKYQILFDKEFKDKIEMFMHVPVDSFIMEAASEEKIEIKRDNKKCKTINYGIYTEHSSLVWSQWDNDTYYKFQKDLRNKIKPQYPIDWEADAWIKVATKRTNKEKND